MSVELRRPISALFSYHYFQDLDMIRRWHAGGLRMVADSGAFSALSLGKPIDLAAFAPWAREVAPYVSWVAALDSIGDATKTWTNYRAMRTLGVNAVPTVHYGAPPQALDRYVDDGVDFIGLGGMVGRKSEPERLLRWALSMMRYARDKHPQLRFHGWGVTHLRLMDLPWYSVDSSGFGSGYRYGRLNLFDPDKRRFVSGELRDAVKHAPLLRKHYGTDPAAVAVSNKANLPLQVAVSVRSAQLIENDLRRRHRVTAPTYGLSDAEQGTSVHYASASSTVLNYMSTPTERSRDGAA